MIRSLLGFFFANKPKTLLSYLAVLGVFGLILTLGLLPYFLSDPDFYVSGLFFRIGQLILLFMAAVLLSADKILIFTFWYALLLIEKYILKQTPDTKINTMIKPLRKPIRRLKMAVQFTCFPLCLISYVVLHAGNGLEYAVMSCCLLFLFTVLVGASTTLIENRLIGLGILNHSAKEFKIHEFYGDVRKLLIHNKVLTDK